MFNTKPAPQFSLPKTPAACRCHRNPQAPSARRLAAKKVDSPWPRAKIDGGDEKVVMYQPQPEAWEGEELRAYTAISVKRKDSRGVVAPRSTKLIAR